jgi:hypothetical protein
MQERGIYSLADDCNETEDVCTLSAHENTQGVREASDVHTGGLSCNLVLV